MRKISVHLVAAARPNFMKIAPLYHALRAQEWSSPAIVHTGQHYDPNMSGAFFRDLRLPDPDFHLNVGSGTHSEQTGGVMIAYEKVCRTQRPDWIIVVGDVNSTAACAIVGAKLCIPVVHLEAGLRSRDRRMPEEINRLVTDAIADVLWIPSADAAVNLRAEGVADERMDFVGNIMIDSYEMLREQIEADRTYLDLGLKKAGYAIVTLHRPSNVDHKQTMQELVRQLVLASQELPLVFALHPRTRKKLDEFGLLNALTESPRVSVIDPLGYIQFMNLVIHSSAAITDSGGVQEETTYLGIPCLTLRENTERPITISAGTNCLVEPAELLDRVQEVVAGKWSRGGQIAGWDGNSAQRCAEALARRAGIRP